ncbi:MAG: hypothetical protein ACUVXH_03565 [Anaerolineae bacterium]
MKARPTPLVLTLLGILLAWLLPAAQAVGNASPHAWLDPASAFQAYLPLTLHEGPLPPTPTPTPTAIPTPAWRYHVAGLILGRADSSGCGFQGRILDAAGAPQQGVQVRVWAEGWPTYTPTPSDGEGRWQVQVASAPVDVTWHLAVVDERGALLSPVADVPTHADARNGHQWYTVTWQEMTTVPEYVVASARRLACLENKGNHNLYIKVYDRQGRGVDGLWLRNAWQGGYDDRITYTKNDPYLPPPVPQGAGYADFALWASVAEYTVRVRDFGSDAASGITTRLDAAVEDPACTQAWNGWGHWSYLVVFQRSRDGLPSRGRR